jgi:hypothetical protein
LILGEGLQFNSSKFMRGDSVIPPGVNAKAPNGHERGILDLSILRNRHYQITARIKNFGLTGDQDMDVYLNVVKWNPIVSDPGDVGDYTLNVSQSQFTIPKNHTAAVTVETDHPEGWNAYVATTSSDSILLYDRYNSSKPWTDSLTRQEPGPSNPLKFKLGSSAVSGTAYYIDVNVDKIIKRIKVTAQ